MKDLKVASYQNDCWQGKSDNKVKPCQINAKVSWITQQRSFSNLCNIDISFAIPFFDIFINITKSSVM